MALTYVINERPLTDDTLTIAEDGEAFKGGYQAILTYHTYANAWGDHEHVRRFRTVEAAEAFIVKRYGKSWEELVYGDPDDVDAGLEDDLRLIRKYNDDEED